MNADRKIFVFPTDFSDASGTAISQVKEMVEQFGGVLHLVHVLEDIPYVADFSWNPGPAGELREKRTAAVRQALAEWREKMGLTVDECETVILHGTPSLEIVEYARAHGAFMVVMATHGRTGLSHLLLGSTAERVVRLAECPVLTVRVQDTEDAEG